MVIPFTKKEATDFKKEFQKHAKEQVLLQKWEIELTRDKHHYVDCVFYFPRIDMDENNYFKVLLDALNGIAYIDDKKVLTRTNYVFYDSVNPRIEITIHPVEYVGIFPNEYLLNEFKNKCESCSRFKRNCSILSKSIEGRILPEVDINFTCSKYKQVKE